MTTGIGETLRAAREAQGRSVVDVARDLRARPDQVRALEEERFGAFAGDAYARAFLRSYARALALDSTPLLEALRGPDPVAVPELAPDGHAFRGPRPPRAPAERRLPVVLGWAALAALATVGLLWLSAGDGGRNPAAAPVTEEPLLAPPTAPRPGATAPSPDVGPVAGPEPAPVTGPEPLPEEVGVRLVLSFEQECWLEVRVDGVAVEPGRIVGAGQTLEYRGAEEVVARFGNAGGVRQQLGDEDLGAPGGPGQVVTVRYSSGGAERV